MGNENLAAPAQCGKGHSLSFSLAIDHNRASPCGSTTRKNTIRAPKIIDSKCDTVAVLIFQPNRAPSGGKAWFSNYGGWVDACAPGVDVRSTFYGTDAEPLKEPVGELDDGLFNEFKGWAMWSGTSFAAPKVAAVIAAEAARLGVTAPVAWKQLSYYKHYRYPDLGVVFNVV